MGTCSGCIPRRMPVLFSYMPWRDIKPGAWVELYGYRFSSKSTMTPAHDPVIKRQLPFVLNLGRAAESTEWGWWPPLLQEEREGHAARRGPVISMCADVSGGHVLASCHRRSTAHLLTSGHPGHSRLECALRILKGNGRQRRATPTGRWRWRWPRRRWRNKGGRLGLERPRRRAL